MIRKLILPALAVALLAGCVTGDYARPGNGRGDYYYGSPSTEYRYPYGGYGPYGYGGSGGYGGYGYGGVGYGVYGVPRGYYGYPYGGYYPRPVYRPYYRHHDHHPPLTQNPRPDEQGPPQQRPDNGRPPWRNLDQLRRRQSADGGGGGMQQPPPLPSRPEAGAPRESGPRMQQTIRRANREAQTRVIEQEP